MREFGNTGMRECGISGTQKEKRKAGKGRDAGIRNPCLLQKYINES